MYNVLTLACKPLLLLLPLLLLWLHEFLLQVMLADIEACKANGADGVVLGCLTPDGQVDAASTAKLVKAAKQQVGTAACLEYSAARCSSVVTLSYVAATYSL